MLGGKNNGGVDWPDWSVWLVIFDEIYILIGTFVLSLTNDHGKMMDVLNGPVPR